jgi:hypothetical protein
VKRFYSLSQITGFLALTLLLCASPARAQLTVNSSSMNFGSVQVGALSTQALILTNSGKSDLTVSQGAITGAAFNLNGPAFPMTLTAGQSATFGVTFSPVASGKASGAISLITATTAVHDRSGKHNSVSSTATNVSLSGTGTAASQTTVTPGNLTANPGSLAFGGVQVGSSQTQSTTLTNYGGSSVTITNATAGGTGFGLSGLNLPVTLAAGQSVTFSVTFSPLSAGNASGSVQVSSDASTPILTISLAGTGAAQGQLSVSPVSSDFGSVTVGTSKIQSGKLIASGASVTLSSGNVTDSEFSLGGISFPLTIAAGQSVPFTLTFVPRASGQAAATMAFASNAANAASENLTGTGVAPVQHSVSLSWDTAAEVVGYNVYRASQSGGPYAKVNSVIDAATTYTDSSVQAGQNYYYVTTSVSSTGTQSSYSNEIQAAIPTL